MAKKYAVRKNSETSMKTIHTKTVFNQPDQYVRCVAQQTSKMETFPTIVNSF